MNEVRQLIAIFVCVLSVYSCSNNELKKTESIEFTPNEFERLFKNVEFDNIELNFTDGFELLAPMSIKYSNEHYYIADNIKGKIYVFDEKFVLSDSIAQSRGKGPGELLHILDFEVNKDEVYVIDGKNLSLNKFSTNGGFLTSKKLDRIPARLTLKKNDIVVLNTSPGDLFSIYDGQDFDKKDETGEYFNGLNINFMTLFGHLEPRHKGGFIYVPKYQSSLYYFDENSEIEFVKSRPDGVDFPTRNETANNGESRAPKAEVPAFETSTDMRYIYVGNYLRDFGEQGEDVMDVFDKVNGEYLYSFVMPFGCVDFVITGNRFVCLERGERVKLFEINLN